MSTREPLDKSGIAHSLAGFHLAVDDWHRRCHHVCLMYDRCPDRFFAIVKTLVTWMAEHPEHARLYSCDDGTCLQPELLAHAVAARQNLTEIILRHTATGPPNSRRHIQTEFLIGIIFQIVREELRKTPVDHARLADKLTRLAPLMGETAYAEH